MGVRVLRLLGLALFVLLQNVISCEAQVESKIALIIGNARYIGVPQLVNPKNDAEDVAAAFAHLGYDVTLKIDLDFASTRRALQEFAKKAEKSDVAIVYYTGHGLEVNGNNYLIPVDAKLETANSLEFEATPLDLFFRAIDGAKRFRLIMLDAGRDNPLARASRAPEHSRAGGR